MAEDFSRHRQYQYQQTSNLVLEADRDRRRRTDKATGEVESLRGKLTGTLAKGMAELREKVGGKSVLVKYPDIRPELPSVKPEKDSPNGSSGMKDGLRRAAGTK